MSEQVPSCEMVEVISVFVQFVQFLVCGYLFEDFVDIFVFFYHGIPAQGSHVLYLCCVIAAENNAQIYKLLITQLHSLENLL